MRRRSIRLWQIDAAEPGGRVRAAVAWEGHAGRGGGHRASPAHRDGLPGAEPVPLAVGAGQRGVRPAQRGAAEGRGEGTGQGDAGEGRPGQVREDPAERSVRGDAAEGGHRPHARPGAGGAPAGRAVRRARRAGPQAHGPRAPQALGTGRPDVHVHHPQHRRSDRPGEPHRADGHQPGARAPGVEGGPSAATGPLSGGCGAAEAGDLAFAAGRALGVRMQAYGAARTDKHRWSRGMGGKE